MGRKCILASLFLVAQCVVRCQPAPIPAIGAVTIEAVEFPRNSHDAHTVLEARLDLGNREIDFFGSLPGLVMNAYRVGDYQIVGAPDWTDESGRLQYYDVAFAKSREPEPDSKQLQQVLQNVLSERFHLRFHRETRKVPGYDLVVGEDGPRFKAAPQSAAIDHSPISWQSSRKYNRNFSITDLTNLIANALHRPVLDKTGISGIFDFTESVFAPSENVLSQEVQEQLGLKLVPATKTIEVLVIDHAERPSEN